MANFKIPKRQLASSVEIDEDLAEILGLLSTMVSDIAPSVGYLNDLSCSLRHLTGARYAVIWLAFERGDETVFVVGGEDGLTKQIDLNKIDIIGDHGILEQVWVTKKGMLDNRYLQHGTLTPFYPVDQPAEQPVAVMCAPMLRGKKCFGMILMGAESSQQFDPTVFVGLQHAAGNAALFLHQFDLLDQVRNLFHDLEYMIQEWKSDVSGRLKKVERSGILLGKILSDLSHEFKTPIASLRLYSGLIQKRPAKAEHYLETMGLEISRLERLLEGILELSEFRIYSTNQVLKRVKLDQLFEKCRTIASAEGDPQILIPQFTEYCVEADENYLFHAIDQLISNAFKYGEGSDVVVSAERDENSLKPTILIKIIDQGPGIPAKDVKYIFNPFYRGYGAGQSAIFGAGLGLTYAREIINSFGGTLSLADNSDVGTTMEVRLHESQ